MGVLKKVVGWVLIGAFCLVIGHLARTSEVARVVLLCLLWGYFTLHLYRIIVSGVIPAGGQTIDRNREPERFEKHFTLIVLAWLLFFIMALFEGLSAGAEFIGWLDRYLRV